MKTTRQDIGVYKTDTEFCLFVDNIGNDSDTNIDDVIIRVDVPAGVVYSGTDNLEQGSYDSGSSIWNVGTLIKNTTIQGTICFKVTDPTAAPYSFTFTIETPDGCSGCNDDLQFCIIADGMSCADVQSCATVNYSTTEQDTGSTWIDGKNIYRQVIDLTGYTPAAAIEVLSNGPTQAYVDTVTSFKVRYYDTNQSAYNFNSQPLYDAADATYYGIYLANANNYFQAVIEYTKA